MELEKAKKILKRFTVFMGVIFFAAVVSIVIAFVTEKNSVAVLNYHQINDADHNALTVSVKDFEEQMRYLSENGYNTITVDEMLNAFKNNAEIPSKTVIITFDDGYQDNFKNAYPILQKYDLKATMFVITDYVSLYPNYIMWDEAKEMQDSGVMNLESHTMDHLNLLKIDKDEAELQLRESKMWLEKHLKKPVKFIAYPEGDYNKDTIAILKKLGYEGAFTVSFGLVSKSDDPYEMPRVPIFGAEGSTNKRFKLRLTLAPILVPVENLKKTLEGYGFNTLADLIYVP